MMVIPSDFHTRQYRDDDHQEDAPHFRSKCSQINVFNLQKLATMYPIYILLHKWKWSRENINYEPLWLTHHDERDNDSAIWKQLFSHLSFLRQVCNRILPSNHLQVPQTRLHLQLHLLLQLLLAYPLQFSSSFSFYPSLFLALKGKLIIRTRRSTKKIPPSNKRRNWNFDPGLGKMKARTKKCQKS